MERMQLTVQPRTILGKKVKQLRKAGTIPGHIYGYDIDPVNVAVNHDAMIEVFKHSGETGLVDINIDGNKYPVLIKDIQRHALTGNYLNIDFYKVNLKEKVTVTIPILPIGEPEAVTSKIGLLEQPLSEVEIEALPTDLIEHIEVDVAALAQLEDSFYIKNLSVPSTVTILADPDDLVFRIGELVTADMEEALEAEAAAAEEAAETGEEGKEETNAEEATQEEVTDNQPVEE